MAPSADSPRRSRETQSRKLKPRKVFLHLWIGQEVNSGVYFSDCPPSSSLLKNFSASGRPKQIQTSKCQLPGSSFLCLAEFSSFPLPRPMPPSPQKKPCAPHPHRMILSYQVSVSYINMISFSLQRPQTHLHLQSVTLPGKQSLLNIMLE